jgi:hypothetical protein
METFLLSDEAFAAAFAAPMRNVTQDTTAVIDMWPYVAAVNSADLAGHEIHDQLVEYVYRDAKDRYDHVLVMTKTKNVYLAVVVDLIANRVHGHYLLNLNEKYGLDAEGIPSTH